MNERAEVKRYPFSRPDGKRIELFVFASDYDALLRHAEADRAELQQATADEIAPAEEEGKG